MDERKIDQVDGEELIDLSRLFREFRSVLRRLFWLPVALTLLVGALWCLRGKLNYRPMYASEVTFTIQVAASGGSDIGGATTAYYDKATAEQMGKTFPYLIQSDLMYSRLCRYLGVSRLNGSITAQTVPDTNLFTIRATSEDPAAAKELLEAVMTVYPEVADYVIGNTTMNVLAEPREAREPYNAFRPVRSFAKGAVLGLALGLGILALCALARHTVRDAEDVRLKLNQPCLGALPKVRFKRRGRPGSEVLTIRNERVSGAFRESVRSLRIKLLRRLPETACPTLLVTSTMPGEGKTTVAANLALSLAENGLRVILVDLDLRHPTVKKALGVSEPSSDAKDLVDGRLNVEASLLPVEGLPLWLLAGSTVSRDAQQMDARKLAPILEELRTRADVVILDTPPCGLLADSVNVARAADCAVYVVGSGGAEVSHIQDSMQFLAESGVTLLGCVLNGTESSRGGIVPVGLHAHETA